MKTRTIGICWKTSIAFLLFGFVASAHAAPLSARGRPKAGAGSSGAASSAVTVGSPSAKSHPAAPAKEGPAAKDPPPGSSAIGCDDDPDCAEAVQRAINQSESHHYDDALKTYEAVYQRWPTPWLLINLGRVQQKLDLPELAIESYQRYLKSAPNDKPQRISVARAYLQQAEQEIQLKRYQNMLTDARRTERPVYKKWWLWTALGGVVVAAVAGGAAAGAQAAQERRPSQNFVNFSLFSGSF